MRKQTVWLLILFLGVFFAFLFAAGGRRVRSKNYWRKLALRSALRRIPIIRSTHSWIRNKASLNQQAVGSRRA